MHSSYTLILCVVSISHYTQPLFLITVLLLHQVTYQTVFSHCNPSFISLICDHSVIIKLIIHLCILHSSVLRPSTLSSTIHPFIHHPPFHSLSTLMVLCSMYRSPYSTHLTHLSNYSPTHHLPPAIFCCRGAGSLSPWRDQRLLKSSMTSRISP